MLESRICKTCNTWHLYWMSTGRPKRDDDGNVLTYDTKRGAEKARREFERGSTGFERPKSDRFAGRKRV